MLVILYVLVAIIISAIIAFKIHQHLTCGVCRCEADMKNKVVIVTGANTGIGFETAKKLAELGAKVILACRSREKGLKACSDIKSMTGNEDVVFHQLDLTSFLSIQKFVDAILLSENRLDVLINNAGTGKLDNSLTKDNLPIETQVNHFGPFLLTMLLMPLIKKSSTRIINVSSLMHKFGNIDIKTFHKPAKTTFQHMRVYSNTKLANILFTKKLSSLLQDTEVTVNCLHPGAVNTDIFRDKNFIAKFLIRLIFKTPWQGAQTSIHLAISPDLAKVTGKYFVDCRESAVSKAAQNIKLADELWLLSENLTINKINEVKGKFS